MKVREVKLEIYADADCGGDLESRKSTWGNLYLLGKIRINWSKEKKSIALSSAEAEYVSAVSASLEIDNKYIKSNKYSTSITNGLIRRQLVNN